MRPVNCALLATFLLGTRAAPGQVVINEIFYNAPDDVAGLQWIEVHNTSDAVADVGRWTLDDGGLYSFPAGTSIEAKGFLVVALEPDRFAKAYGARAIGPLARALKRGGEKIELKDTRDRVIDVAAYKDEAPWPASPDGYSASLERICPSSAGDVAENWAASPLPATPKPAGTPGRQNAGFFAALPPVVSLKDAPSSLPPQKALRVEAEVRDRGAIREVTLLYRVVSSGEEEEKEAAVSMTLGANSRFVADIPGQRAGSLVRYRVRAVGESGAARFFPDENGLRPTISIYVHDEWTAAQVPFGIIIRGGPERTRAIDGPFSRRGPPLDEPQVRGARRGPPPGFAGGPPGFGGPRGRGGVAEPRAPRGDSAFIYVEPGTGKSIVFDHIHARLRNGGRGFNIFFHKDQTLRGQRSVNLVFEGSERFLLAEALAFEVYRRAGCPAPLTEFVRVWVDGQMVGYHLLVERLNRSFLRRNKLDDSGNLYKLLWFERDIVGKHEKRTNESSGHEDLLAVIELLEKTSGDKDEQWKAIQEHFDVEQVASYFAVNMVLSHWDGFFNNYFTYHEPTRRKWMMFPWDQDKSWGYYDGLREGEVFFDMPLSFGSDESPGGEQGFGGREPRGRGRGRGGFGGPGRGGQGWWRPSGHFSGPLLANPHFRKVFLSRIRKILEEVYTEEACFPRIDELARRLGEDVKLRAQATGRETEEGTRELSRNVAQLKAHVVKRRVFLIKQLEEEG